MYESWKICFRSSKGADYAFEKGWILEEDRDAYTQAAAHCAVGHGSTEDITMGDLKACHEL